MGRPYGDDTTIDDLQSGDQLSVVCSCGRNLQPAWRTMPRPVQLTPLRDLHGRFLCQRCGRRAPAFVIYGFIGRGSRMGLLWVWPEKERDRFPEIAPSF